MDSNKSEQKEVLSAGICDICENCMLTNLGLICVVKDIEIEPIPEGEQLMECEHFKMMVDFE